MITLEKFYLGRDRAFASELTPELHRNAIDTVERANRLLAAYTAATGDRRPRGVTSGWRPPTVNSRTANAAPHSQHMLCRAIDIADASRTLSPWLLEEEGQLALIDCELWLEHPSATPTWVHVQTVPPRSGRRVFMP